MRHSPTLTTLVLATGMLLVGGAQSLAATKPTGGSVSGDLVISKVFYNNMKDDADNAYILANYVELYNNSDKELDITGIYIGLSDNTSATSKDYDNAWTAANMAEVYPGKIALVQIFQIPTDMTRTLLPGESVVVCNCAIDHTAAASKAPNLSGADFEVKSELSLYASNHNDNVPELPQVFSYNSSSTYIQWMSPGPCGIVLLAADTKVDECETGYYKGQTEGTKLFKFVPAYKTIDAVDIVEHSAKTEPDASQKRMPADYDAGWVATVTPGGNTGECVMRRTAFITPSGRKVLFDTNNSTVDFTVTTDLSIREYSNEVEGLSETTVTIPESGYLAINPEKPFYGPQDMILSYVNVTNNASTTDLTYRTYNGNAELLIAGPWIAIAQPGTYTLQLSESQGTVRTRTSVLVWSDEDSKELTGSQKTRMIYKFQNTPGKVGFQRVAKTDEGLYNKATFSDGDRLYFAISTDIAKKIAAANGATDDTDLDFIQWHGSTPGDAAGIAALPLVQRPASTAVYNLQGQRLTQPQRGLNIMGGKKFFVK